MWGSQTQLLLMLDGNLEETEQGGPWRMGDGKKIIGPCLGFNFDDKGTKIYIFCHSSWV